MGQVKASLDLYLNIFFMVDLHGTSSFLELNEMAFLIIIRLGVLFGFGDR